MRELYYNINITLVSVLVALVVGAIEALSILSCQLKLSGAFWTWIGHLSSNFGTLGFIIIGIFIASWGISTLFICFAGTMRSRYEQPNQYHVSF